MSRQNLSRRELEVGALFVDGNERDEIATELSIDPHTVDVHLDHIIDKVGDQRWDDMDLRDWLQNWFGVSDP